VRIMHNPYKEISLNLTVGNHNTQQPTKIHITLARDPDQVNELFNRTNNQLNAANDIVIEASFPCKNLSPMVVGENVSALKNYLNTLKEPMQYKISNLEQTTSNDYYGTNKIIRLSFGWEYSENLGIKPLSDNINKLIDGGFHNIDFMIEVNQKFPQSPNDVDEQKLTGKASLNAKVTEASFNNEIKKLKEPFNLIFPLFRNGKLELAVHSLEYALEMGIIPWPDGLPKFTGFVGLKQLLVPQMAITYQQVKNEFQDTINVFEDAYKKIFETVSGVSEVRVAFRGFVLKFKFEGFDIFNGFLPDIDTIKELGGVDHDGF